MSKELRAELLCTGQNQTKLHYNKITTSQHWKTASELRNTFPHQDCGLKHDPPPQR